MLQRKDFYEDRPIAKDCAKFVNVILHEFITNQSSCGSPMLSKGSNNPDYVPTRLLYVGHEALENQSLLYEPATHMRQPYGTGNPHVELSHCWGK